MHWRIGLNDQRTNPPPRSFGETHEFCMALGHVAARRPAPGRDHHRLFAPGEPIFANAGSNQWPCLPDESIEHFPTERPAARAEPARFCWWWAACRCRKRRTKRRWLPLMLAVDRRWRSAGGDPGAGPLTPWLRPLRGRHVHRKIPINLCGGPGAAIAEADYQPRPSSESGDSAGCTLQKDGPRFRRPDFTARRARLAQGRVNAEKASRCG